MDGKILVGLGLWRRFLTTDLFVLDFEPSEKSESEISFTALSFTGVETGSGECLSLAGGVDITDDEFEFFEGVVVYWRGLLRLPGENLSSISLLLT